MLSSIPPLQSVPNAIAATTLLEEVACTLDVGSAPPTFVEDVVQFMTRYTLWKFDVPHCDLF